MSRSVRISVMVVLLLSLIPTGTVLAQSPNGITALRGRWDFVAFRITPEGDSLQFHIFINDLEPDPNGETGNEYLAVGCMFSPGADAPAPMSLSATHLGDGVYDLILLSTVIPPPGFGEPFVIQFSGTVTTSDRVIEDVASGTYQTEFKEDEWNGTHHDRRRPHCPAVGNIPIPGLRFDADVYVGLEIGPDPDDAIKQLEGITNIVSTAMLVEEPDGNIIIVPSFTDIFSPEVDFVSEFRYLPDPPLPGYPDSGEVYTFTLLDALGNPIAGTTRTDVWTACLTGAPTNLEPTVTPGVGIDLVWDPVPQVDGFDPASKIGYYQINVWPEFGGNTQYGAVWVASPIHHIPWPRFEPGDAGNPDGYNVGVSLMDLENGNYRLKLDAFSQPASGNPGAGHECFVTDANEDLYFTKGDDSIEFFEVANP